jgi:hypothetical protein
MGALMGEQEWVIITAERRGESYEKRSGMPHGS